MIPNKTRERLLIPPTFQDYAVRTILINGVPRFIAKDKCKLRSEQTRNAHVKEES